MDIQKAYEQGIAALLPIYTERGNETKLVLENGEEEICGKSIRSVIVSLARLHRTDLFAMRQELSRLLQQKNHLPLLFTALEIYVPVKVRVPRCKKDGALGYILLGQVERVCTKQKQAEVFLKNQYRMDILASPYTFHQQMNKARFIAQHIGQKDLGRICADIESLIQYAKVLENSIRVFQT